MLPAESRCSKADSEWLPEFGLGPGLSFSQVVWSDLVARGRFPIYPLQEPGLRKTKSPNQATQSKDVESVYKDLRLVLNWMASE